MGRNLESSDDLWDAAYALMLWLDSQDLDCANGAAVCSAAIIAQLRALRVSEKCVDELLAGIKVGVMA